MPAPDPNTRAYLEWLGFIQPNGLVVSAPALVKAGAILNRQDAEGQSRLLGCIRERVLDPARGPEPYVDDFRGFASDVLGWGFSSRGYAGTEEAPTPAELEVPLPDYGETLRPDFAVRERDPRSGEPSWQLLAQVLDVGQDFDALARGGGAGAGSRLDASPQSRAERLLRGTGVPAGLLCNGTALRLVSAPRGESSGWMDFRVADMSLTAGRPLCSALRLLLSEQRLLALPRDQRLAALLEDSRKYQNEVSERLSEQVMHALYELLRGLQAAHDASGGALLRDPLGDEGDRDDIYRGLLSVILRLVFLLYVEERGMLPEDGTFIRHYSLTGLYRRLREAILPYIGGEEVNTSPTHAHHRYVINFRDYPLRREESPTPWAAMDEEEREECLRTGRVLDDYPAPVAADWPELLTHPIPTDPCIPPHPHGRGAQTTLARLR